MLLFFGSPTYSSINPHTTWITSDTWLYFSTSKRSLLFQSYVCTMIFTYMLRGYACARLVFIGSLLLILEKQF